jgi:hypothetical protein
MKKIFIFTQTAKRPMGGTDTSVGAFATRELAVVAHQAMLDAHKRKAGYGANIEYSDVVEAVIYESEEEFDFI